MAWDSWLGWHSKPDLPLTVYRHGLGRCGVSRTEKSSPEGLCGGQEEAYHPAS